MKVLMIEHFLPGNLYTKELCTELCKNADVTVMTKQGYHDDGKVGWVVKPCLCYTNPPNKLVSFMRIFAGWIRIIKELCFGKYDIVHVQTFKVDTIEMFIYRMFAKGRFVHTAHNILPHEASSKDKKKYGKFYGSCNMIIVHNEYSKKLIVDEYGFLDKIHVIPHGIYESQKKSMNSEPLSVNSNKIEFLQLGIMRKYKGIDVLLKALSLLDDGVKNRIHVTLAGKQYKALDDTDYEKIIRTYKLEPIVTFTPERVEDEEMDLLFKKADVCVFPYREVYGSGALLMAYTYRKPVIVSNIPALIEETAGGMTGISFENEDAASLKEAIEKFVNMPSDEVERFRKNVEKLVNEKYNWKHSAEELISCYQRLLGQEG